LTSPIPALQRLFRFRTPAQGNSSGWESARSNLGQAPSDYREFATFLIEEGIDSISVNPDRFVETTKIIAKAERKR
jgi:hypothetical protein